MSRSCAVKESASSCSRWGSRQTQEGVAGLLEIEPLLPHPLGQPVVLVEAEARGKGEVGTQANEHPAPVSIVDVEVILHEPTLSQLQLPSVVLLVPNGGQDACGFSRLEDDDHLVRLGMTKVGLDKEIGRAHV